MLLTARTAAKDFLCRGAFALIYLSQRLRPNLLPRSSRWSQITTGTINILIFHTRFNFINDFIDPSV